MHPVQTFPVSLRSILILSFQLRLDLPSGLSPFRFLDQHFVVISHLLQGLTGVVNSCTKKINNNCFWYILTFYITFQLIQLRQINWNNKHDGNSTVYEGVSKSFRTGRLERELQIVQLSATRCSCIAILWVSLATFAAITLCVASERVFVVLLFRLLSTQSGHFWIYPRITSKIDTKSSMNKRIHCHCSFRFILTP
jgi:hypothetical protein